MPTRSREDVLSKYVGDMHAVVKHVLGAHERQVEDKDLQANPEAHMLVSRIAGTLRSHHTRLHAMSEKRGALDDTLKEALTAVTGAAAGLYDKIRSHPVSKMLRDDYTALTLMSMAYEMLYTTGLALKDEEVADTALAQLKDLPPLIMEIGHLVPTIVTRELANDGLSSDANVAETAARNVEAAWRAQSKAA